MLRALLLQCLRARAQSEPLLLVLDDCHWIDPLSQELVEYLSRNLQDLPILLIAGLSSGCGRGDSSRIE